MIFCSVRMIASKLASCSLRFHYIMSNMSNTSVHIKQIYSQIFVHIAKRVKQNNRLYTLSVNCPLKQYFNHKSIEK